MSVRPDRGPAWIPLAVFLAALAVRLAFVAEQSQAPLFEYRGIDADRYHEMALGWLQGRWPGGRALDWPPLYSVFLGSLYRLLGSDVAVIKVAQAVIGAASCVLIHQIALETFRRPALAVAAAGIGSLCGTLIFFDAELLSANLDLFLQLLSLALLLRAAASGQLVWWGLAGCVLGLSAISRGGALIFLPVVAVWIFCLPAWNAPAAAGGSRKTTWLRLAAVVVPVLVTMAPVGWHNTRYDVPLAPGGKRLGAVMGPGPGRPLGETIGGFVPGGFLRTGSVVGFNLYLGNDWALRDTNDVRYADSLRAIGLVYHEPFANGAVTLAEHDQYMRRKTFRVIGEAPLDWLRLMARKGLQILHGDEIPRNRSMYADREHSLVLSALLWKKIVAFPSGLLIPLGLLGVFLARSTWREQFPMLGLLAVQVVTLSGFYVTARYRTPLLALLSVYAAFALLNLPEAVRRQRSGWGRALPLVAAAILLVASNFRIGPMASEPFSFEYRGYGSQLRRAGRLDEAIEQYRAAVRVGGERHDTHLGLAAALAERGDRREAVASFVEGLRIAPDKANGWLNLGVQYLGLGEPEQAAHAFRQALALDPSAAEAHHNLSVALGRTGHGDEARFHRDEARRLRLEARRAGD